VVGCWTSGTAGVSSGCVFVMVVVVVVVVVVWSCDASSSSVASVFSSSLFGFLGYGHSASSVVCLELFCVPPSPSRLLFRVPPG